MALLPFSIFKNGSNQYEIVDASARSSITSINNALNNKTNISSFVVTNGNPKYDRCYYSKCGNHAFVNLAFDVTTASATFSVKNLKTILGITSKTLLRSYGVAHSNHSGICPVSVDVLNNLLWIECPASQPVNTVISLSIDVYFS